MFITISKVIRKYIIIIVCFIAASSCQNKPFPQDSPIALNLINIPLREEKLSEFIEELSYIKLENSIPIKSIRKIQISDKLIVVSEGRRLFLFDIHGNYIREIGKRGRGPGEFSYIIDFTLDIEANNLFILNSNGQILKYSITEGYIETFEITQKIDFDKISCFSDKIILSSGNPNGTDIYNWIVLNDKGVFLSGKKNYLNFSYPQNSVNIYSHLICRHANEYLYISQFCDTVFSINEDGYYPKYTIPGNKIEVSDYLDQAKLARQRKNLDRHILMPINLMETNDHIFYQYYQEEEMNFVHLNKRSGTICRLKDNPDRIGIENNIDDGISFLPKYYTGIKNGEFLFDWVDAYKLVQFVQSKAFKDSMPKYPEKKKELEKLANSLSENDNPVLMVVKLKD